eukprot:CAMPEP_0206028910 /NCGR_PEP_ID=MMETSP1464-20131121/45815_1 /ASSEMBLY_ACC=CAM_ASM_001124 /TAXON_ID=119497 /ORGANISM="Exanthemachrysis gayraliae, Strain RCC1523" /LENGTH=112 /DNA_ID=CAMNT_0053402983 /DNA_START=142 /DNA_END=477 /DNA_ORIENTATION=+
MRDAPPTGPKAAQGGPVGDGQEEEGAEQDAPEASQTQVDPDEHKVSVPREGGAEGEPLDAHEEDGPRGVVREEAQRERGGVAPGRRGSHPPGAPGDAPELGAHHAVVHEGPG